MMSSQSGQVGSGEVGFSGRGEEQASQRGSCRRLFAVRREDSWRTVSPGAMSAVAKRPSWVMVGGNDIAGEEVFSWRMGRETARTSHLGATFFTSLLREARVLLEKRSGSWVFHG